MPAKPSLRSRRLRSGTTRTGPARALAFLARVAAEYTGVLSLPDLLKHIMHVLREEVGFDSCAVSLVERKKAKDVLVVRAGSGPRHAALGPTVTRGKGLAWKVIETGTPLLVPDVRADSRMTRKDRRVRSGIYAPLVTRGQAVGVLSAYRTMVGAFSESDLHLLTIVARYIAGAVEVARLDEQLKETTATDALTGLPNRRHFLGRLMSEIARSARTNRPLTVALVDLDGFKATNDRFGHATGDQVLMHVAQAVVRGVRASDLVARYGGDEFALLLPETEASETSTILARLTTPEILLLRQQKHINVSLCWGIATWPADGQSPDQLLLQADGRLNEMKRRRKHRGRPGR